MRAVFIQSTIRTWTVVMRESVISRSVAPEGNRMMDHAVRDSTGIRAMTVNHIRRE